MGWALKEPVSLSRVFVALAALLAANLLPAAAIATAQAASKEGGRMNIELSSSAFAAGQTIPVVYSCRGRDISPPLQWSGGGSGVKSYALIVDDPDAPMGIWVHWVYFNIPASTHALPAGVKPGPRLPDGSIQGIGSSGDNRYHGPCPPSGRHRYFFKLYALDRLLDLGPSADRQAVLQAMRGHILAEGRLMGYFSK